jgi:hypothetical protein
MPETGGNGSGKGELEYYANRLKNTHIQNGALAITAFRE